MSKQTNMNDAILQLGWDARNWKRDTVKITKQLVNLQKHPQFKAMRSANKMFLVLPDISATRSFFFI